MKKFLLVALGGMFAMNLLVFPAAHAASECEAKAVSKDGKPLFGAAKATSIKKCEADSKTATPSAGSCAEKAIDKNGKALAGAAKTSFLKKCEADGKAGK